MSINYCIEEIVPRTNHYSKTILSKQRKGISCLAFVKGNRIGFVDFVLTKNLIYESHAYLDAAWRGQGIGTDLYILGIKFLLLKGVTKIGSSKNTSEQAKRVWKKLYNKFPIKRIKGRFRVITNG